MKYILQQGLISLLPDHIKATRPMRKRLSIVIILLIFGCVRPAKTSHLTVTTAAEDKTSMEINTLEVLKSDLELNQIEGRWYYKGKRYNGYALKFHSNGILGERLGFINGSREGLAQQWSANGVLRVECTYRNNRLDGLYKTWWENAERSKEAHYESGILNGEEKQWYPNGQLAKLRNIVNGKEAGLQKGWLKSGKIYVNYEVKNGRIYGMRRTNLCYQLEDEVVKRD